MRTKNRQAARRVIALAALLCFVMVSLLSEAFILLHTNHSHKHASVGGGCAVCTQIQNIEKRLKQCSVYVSLALLGLAGFFAALARLCFTAASITRKTPVCLRIRLNN